MTLYGKVAKHMDFGSTVAEANER